MDASAGISTGRGEGLAGAVGETEAVAPTGVDAETVGLIAAGGVPGVQPARAASNSARAAGRRCIITRHEANGAMAPAVTLSFVLNGI